MELHNLIKASYQRNKPAEEIGFKHGLTLDHELSNSEHKVFVDPDKNTTVVFTGSRKVGDWLFTNPAIAVGLEKHSQRFINSDKLISNVKNKYNGNVTAIGHSLGGRIAEHVNANNKITVNKAVGLGDIGKTIRNNQTDIHVNHDIVSTLSSTQKHKGNNINIANKQINPLIAHNYSHVKKISNPLNI